MQKRHSHTMRITRVLLLSCLILAFAHPLFAQETGLSAILKRLVDEAPDLYRQDLTEVYTPRHFEPFWVSTSNHLNAEGLALLKTFERADRLGLNPKDYDQSELHWLQRTDSLFPDDQRIIRSNVLARFELVLSKNLLKILDHVTGGRLSPEHINGKWYLEDERLPLTDLFQHAVDNGVVTTLNALAGGHEGYAPLLQALNRYLQIQEEGGWPSISDGPLLAQGSRGARVKLLRARLQATNDIQVTTPSTRYDQTLEEGVKSFQSRHGITVDGMVGPQTLEVLNTPVETRIKQLLVNLERRRWMPRSFGDHYLLVNIPDFHLSAYRDGERQLEMPVIVGKPMSQTPIFGDVLEYIVMNPYWNVPRSITTEELLPKIQEDADYLEHKNFEIVDWDDQPVEFGPDVPQQLEEGALRLRQKPGPENALGLVKFMFPNDHAIYLHDTPAGHLFDASERDFSHGCIRVERPTDLANFLLQEQWSREDILNLLQREERREIELPQTTPVYILYLTTWVAEDGTVQFRDDPYGHDERLWTALRPVLTPTVRWET